MVRERQDAHKKNTFTDFVACARHLIAEGRTTPGQLVADGGSAGGLLMGAVANLAPELFAGILANVPFVDPLTSILDPDLPLTVIEWDEWGNPLEDPQVYEYMRSYSPYEKSRPRTTRYPRDHQQQRTRVLYVNPRSGLRRCARRRRADSPAAAKTEMSAGHGGVSGRSTRSGRKSRRVRVGARHGRRRLRPVGCSPIGFVGGLRDRCPPPPPGPAATQASERDEIG